MVAGVALFWVLVAVIGAMSALAFCLAVLMGWKK